MENALARSWNRALCNAIALCVGVATSCEQPPLPTESGLYAACYDGAGLCVPANIVDEAQRSLLEAENCRAELLCVPRNLARGAVPERCDSIAGAEGRCLLERLPLIAAQPERLPISFCPARERCAPCYDPFSGEATGACTLPGDAGPTLPPRVFGRCCAGAGRCLPPELLSEAQRAQLGRDACADAELCVPQPLLDGDAPNRCESLGAVEGRCLPSCLPLIAEQIERLPSAGCAADQRCAPCFDPLTGDATGACTLPSDRGPLGPAQTFGDCCAGAGRCLPNELIAPEQQRDLAQAECRATELCAPAFLVKEQAPPSCSSVGSVEGRCLPDCLPLIAMQLDRLPRASCAQGQRCAPCFDPFTGDATGACTLPNDPGPVGPAVTFASCCGAIGHCLPPELVPGAQRKDLPRDSCGELQLCAPDSLRDGLAPARCASIAGFEGRCLSDCLPLVAAQKDRLPRADCADHERCAPCADPFSGEATGACALPNDPGPSADPARFLSCCEGRGYCLPSDLVATEQRASLAAQGCSDTQLCAPAALAQGIAPISCDSVAGAEGRCVSECVPLVAAQVELLPRATCADGERCAPCFDPFSGDATGSCSLPGDAGPTRKPLVFADCCNSNGAPRGRCVPPELVPQDKRSLLMAAGCAGNNLCLPTTLVPPATALPRCNSASGAGACVPSCLLTSTQLYATSQADCHVWERCVPCSVLGMPSGVCD